MRHHVVTLCLAATTALAAPNEPCYADGQAGVCTTEAACAAANGTTATGACPADGTDIKCCSKARCGPDGAGNCRWQSDCAGSSTANLCPGPPEMQCCSSRGPGFGGYAAPAIPPVGDCKPSSVEGAKKIAAAFPGRVWDVGCKRDCECPGTSDHCCGLASDMMCSDGLGVPTLSGKQIAEWVMRNRKDLKLKYVIWGQKIWNPTVDAEPNHWEHWRTMNDRGDVTQNHWWDALSLLKTASLLLS
ncbi:D-alanyl-D-alanine carboxypeptidase, partial [Metarhizium hybridum]